MGFIAPELTVARVAGNSEPQNFIPRSVIARARALTFLGSPFLYRMVGLESTPFKLWEVSTAGHAETYHL